MYVFLLGFNDNELRIDVYQPTDKAYVDIYIFTSISTLFAKAEYIYCHRNFY